MPATDKDIQKRKSPSSSQARTSKEKLTTLSDVFDDNALLDAESGAEDLSDELPEEETKARFFCPNCGEIPRDEVLFMCNNCDASEIMYKDGVFVCPQCFYPGDNFECTRCGNRKVVAKFSD